MPPPVLAVLPEIVVLLIVTRPPKVDTPLPPVLPEIVLFAMETVP